MIWGGNIRSLHWGRVITIATVGQITTRGQTIWPGWTDYRIMHAKIFLILLNLKKHNAYIFENKIPESVGHRTNPEQKNYATSSVL